MVYISGEEAADPGAPARRKARALNDAPVELAAETAVEDIIATLSAGRTPSLVVINSIQTLWTGAPNSTPGTVTQVRGAAPALVRLRKCRAPGHPGRTCDQGRPDRGPHVVEHMVDAVALVRRRRRAIISASCAM